MDRWMDKYVCTDGRIGGYVDGWMDAYMHTYMNGWMDGWMGRCGMGSCQVGDNE